MDRSFKMDLIAFKKKYKVKKISELHKFNSEISQLIEEGFSQKSICEFLRLNGVDAKQSNLSQYIKRQQQPKKVKEDLEIEKKPTPQKTTTPSNLFKKSEVKSFEIIEPDYSQFQR